MSELSRQECENVLKGAEEALLLLKGDHEKAKKTIKENINTLINNRNQAD